MTDKHHAIVIGIMLAVAVCIGASAWIDREIGKAFILRSPSANSEYAVDPSSLHKDAATVRIYGATEDGLPHVTHELY
jgi:hypothetical protein